MKYFVFAALLAVVIVSCGPSVDPAKQKRIDEYFSTKGGRNIADAGKFVSVMPYEAGQWVIIANKSGNDKSVTKTSVIGKEGDAWIIENYSLTNKQEGIMQICFSGIDKMMSSGTVDDIEIKWIKMKKDDKVEQIDGVALSFVGSFYKKALRNIAVKIDGMTSAGSVTVPAGTFAGVSKINTEIEYFGSTYKSTTYYHSRVPINGMVKSVSDDGKYESELIDYGLTGAKASF